MTCTEISDPPSGPRSTSPGSHRRSQWLVLVVVALAQLTVVLDVTIVNIALPAAQLDLDLSDEARGGVVMVYALAFGSLLLLGGRIADFWGRKRSFLIGMGGFAVASALGGLATSGVVLLAARGLQGACAALLAPAALALLSIKFPAGRDRIRAFAIYGVIGGGGAAAGLILGGVLTEYLSWHWCLLVNVPIAAVALLLAVPLLDESRAEGTIGYDVPGAVAGLEAMSWTPRELRHSFVSLLSSSGMPIEDIAHLVGHANTRVTELVYRKELRPVLTRGAVAMDSLFPSERV